MRRWGIFLAFAALASCQRASERAPDTTETPASTSEEFLDPLVVAPEFY
jgi:hypothetical protein